MNLRYFQKTPNNNLIINNPYSTEEIYNSEDKDYFNSLTKKQLNSLKLYKFNPIKISKEKDEEENIDKSSFIPTKDLLKIDFEKMVKNNDNASIKKYLPQMMFEKFNTKDLPNPENSKLKPLLVKYQESLRYLSNLEKKMNKFNSLLDQHAKKVINEELSNYGQEKSVNKKLEENDKKINKLFKKIDKYKNIINFANKNKKRSLASFVLIIKDSDNNFYCDLCPNEIFESYKAVQIHALSRHEHILKLRKKNYEINNNLTSSYNIEQKYLDIRMKNIQEEFDTLIENINTNKENENIFTNKNYNNNLENEENFDINTNQQISDNDLIILEKKINILEENQTKNQEMLLENLNNLKNEIFTQLKNLQNNQSLFYEEEKNNNIKNDKPKNLNEMKEEKDQNIINNFPIINKNNTTNKNDITDNNIFELGEKYQENTSILESYNYNFNKDENNTSNNNTNQMKNKNNIFFPPKEEKYPITSKEANLNNKYIPDKNKNKINLEKVNQPNFEVNPDNKLDPNVNNFAKKFYEREKNVLFTQKINQPDFSENYKILYEKKISENTEIKKEENLIEKIKDEYNLNKEDLTKSGYNNVINEIINKNENVQNENYKAYFNNIINFLEINKDLNNSIIK